MDSRKHPMTSSRDTTALIRELACSMNVLSAKMENCVTTGLIPTLTISLTQTQMKFHFINGKPRISMSRKFGLRCRLTKSLICLKPVTVLKKHIYSKRVQNREYNRIKESLDCLILVHVEYAKSYKNVHQNEI